MSDSEKTPGDHPEKVEDEGQKSSPSSDPKTTMLPNFGALLKQAAETGKTPEEEGEDEAPELKKGARNGKSTMVPTTEDLAELTRQTVLRETGRKEVKDKKKGVVIIPLKELRDRLGKDEK